MAVSGSVVGCNVAVMFSSTYSHGLLTAVSGSVVGCNVAVMFSLTYSH